MLYKPIVSRERHLSNAEYPIHRPNALSLTDPSQGPEIPIKPFTLVEEDEDEMDEAEHIEETSYELGSTPIMESTLAHSERQNKETMQESSNQCQDLRKPITVVPFSLEKVDRVQKKISNKTAQDKPLQTETNTKQDVAEEKREIVNETPGLPFDRQNSSSETPDEQIDESELELLNLTPPAYIYAVDDEDVDDGSNLGDTSERDNFDIPLEINLSLDDLHPVDLSQIENPRSEEDLQVSGNTNESKQVVQQEDMQEISLDNARNIRRHTVKSTRAITQTRECELETCVPQVASNTNESSESEISLNISQPIEQDKTESKEDRYCFRCNEQLNGEKSFFLPFFFYFPLPKSIK